MYFYGIRAVSGFPLSVWEHTHFDFQHLLSSRRSATPDLKSLGPDMFQMQMSEKEFGAGSVYCDTALPSNAAHTRPGHTRGHDREAVSCPLLGQARFLRPTAFAADLKFGFQSFFGFGIAD